MRPGWSRCHHPTGSPVVFQMRRADGSSSACVVLLAWTPVLRNLLSTACPNDLVPPVMRGVELSNIGVARHWMKVDDHDWPPRAISPRYAKLSSAQDAQEYTSDRANAAAAKGARISGDSINVRSARAVSVELTGS